MLLCGPVAAQEAQDVRYQTTIAPTGEAALDASLTQASRLQRLATDAPVDPYGLVSRALAEQPILDEVLRSEGYWAAVIEVTIAGEPANTPGLATRLRDAPPAGAIPVAVKITLGPRYTYRRIATQSAEPPGNAAVTAIGEPPGLARGEPARAAPVIDAEGTMLTRLREAGYPLAASVDREVVVDHEAQAMDVTWTLNPGPRANFSTPEIAGETRVNQALIARITNRLGGQPYAALTLERTRRELMGLGVFETVRARAAERLDAAGNLPVTFTLSDRPRNAAGATLAYETNYGPSATVYYERRNLFGNAERLRIEASASRLGSEADDTNARLAVNLRRPGLFDGRTTLVTEVAAVRERLTAYDRDAITASILLERPFGERWVLQTGPTFETGKIGRDGIMDPFTLAGWVFGGRYDNTSSPLDPRSGTRAALTVVPYANLGGSGGGFVRAVGTLRQYVELRDEGRTVLALRGSLGSLIGGQDQSVPLDKRFYAGGGGSVRGYAYQSIGPRDRRNRPNGGASLVEGSVELRQRITGNIGAVAFVDAGSVGVNETPSFSDVRVGAGVGMRYATAIGPLRLDVAMPLNKQRGDDNFGVYIGLGQAF